MGVYFRKGSRFITNKSLKKLTGTEVGCLSLFLSPRFIKHLNMQKCWVTTLWYLFLPASGDQFCFSCKCLGIALHLSSNTTTPCVNGMADTVVASTWRIFSSGSQTVMLNFWSIHTTFCSECLPLLLSISLTKSFSNWLPDLFMKTQSKNVVKWLERCIFAKFLLTPVSSSFF